LKVSECHDKVQERRLVVGGGKKGGTWEKEEFLVVEEKRMDCRVLPDPSQE
jgi:hypothetical protein